ENSRHLGESSEKCRSRRQPIGAQANALGPSRGPNRIHRPTGLIKHLMPPGPALAAVLRASTPEALRAVGTHDAIVIGAGAEGGLAALLLAEAGLRVLVLDAGSPPSPMRSAWRRLAGGMARRLSGPAGLGLVPPALVRLRKAYLKVARRRQPIQSRCYAW